MRPPEFGPGYSLCMVRYSNIIEIVAQAMLYPLFC